MQWLGARYPWLLVFGMVIALLTSVATLLLPADVLLWWPASREAAARYGLAYDRLEILAGYGALLGSAAAGILGGILAAVAAPHVAAGRARVPVAFIAALLIAVHLLRTLMHLMVIM